MVPARASLGQWVAHATLMHGILGIESLSAGVWYVAIDFQLFTLMALFTAACWRAPAALRYVFPIAILALTASSLWLINRHDNYEAYAPFFFGYYGLGILAYWTAHTRLGKWGFILMATLGATALWLEFRKAVATGLKRGGTILY